MDDPRPTEDGNELLRYAIDRIMTATAGAFDELWSRPGAHQVAIDFMAGDVTFHIRNDGIEVLRRQEDV